VMLSRDGPMTDDTPSDGAENEPAGSDQGGNTETPAKRIALPYVDNARAILLTVAINLAVVFVFFWPDGVTFNDIILDSVICVIITVIINMMIVHSRLKRLREEGKMPSRVPVSRLMQRLPKNPALLAAVYALVFTPLAVGSIAVALWFYGLEEMGFVAWMSLKVLFAVVTSVIVMEYCIFRYVQPDWAGELGTGDGSQDFVRPVKNPLPKVSVIKEMYTSVTGYIAINLAKGFVLGRVLIEANNVTIHPYIVDSLTGIPLTGITFGFMTGFLVTNGVLRKMNRFIHETGASMIGKAMTERRFAWMPLRRFPLMVFVGICMSAFSCVALWGAMTAFGISEMNFFQFIAMISAYAILMSRPLSFLLTKRCMQRDYIDFTLNGKDRGRISGVLERHF